MDAPNVLHVFVSHREDESRINKIRLFELVGEMLGRHDTDRLERVTRAEAHRLALDRERSGRADSNPTLRGTLLKERASDDRADRVSRADHRDAVHNLVLSDTA
jgi:hypothetical protein